MARKIIIFFAGFVLLIWAIPHSSNAASMLSWDAVSGDVEGYKIYYGTSQGNYPFSKDVGNVTQYSLSGLFLTEDTTYYFVVRAYNDAGESSNSIETSYTVPSLGDTTPPLPPQGVTANASDEIITLNWQANTESDFVGYKVYYGNSTRSYGPSIPVGKITSYTFDFFEKGKTYYLAVSALDSKDNESGYSLEVVKTIPSAPGVAEPVEGPMLKWDAVTGTVTGYKIYYGTSSGSFPYSKDVGNVTQYPLSDLSLAEGTTYYLIVRSYSSAGESDDSDEISYSTETPADTVVPTVAITGPTSGDTYETSIGQVELWGNASDDMGVIEVNWVNSMGGNGVAEGVKSWYIFGIQLSEGENIITVTAADAAGNRSTDRLTVVYTPLDTAVPELSITSPSSESIYQTSNPSITLSGSASDNVGVTQVTWVSSKGESGSAIGAESWTISDISLEEGENILTVAAIDAAGNQYEDTIVVTYNVIDTAAPEISITSPTSEDVYEISNPSISLSGGASDNIGVAEVVWSNDQGGSDVASGTTNWIITDVDLAEGANVITVTVRDAAGNETKKVLRVTYTPPDTIEPLVSISLPTKESSYETDGSSVNLSGSASDNVGVSEVTWADSKGGSGKAIGTESWSVSGIQLSEGSNTLIVTAKDAVGNQSTDTLTIAYSPPETSPPQDSTAPVVSIKSPTTMSRYRSENSSISLSGSASDNVGVSEVTWSNSKGSSGKAIGTESWSVFGIQLSEGRNTLTVTAKDTVGNESKDTLTVTYRSPDAVAPAVSITSPTWGGSWNTKKPSIDLSGSASDNVGVSQITWINSRGGKGKAIGTESWSISAIQLSDGDNVLTVTAEDTAGNQSTDTLTVRYSYQDTTAPVVSITSPTTRKKYLTRYSSISLSGSASDNVGVTKVTWINSLGGSGTAIGTESWSITNITLGKDENVVTVTARDAAGNKSTDTLKVIKK